MECISYVATNSNTVEAFVQAWLIIEGTEFESAFINMTIMKARSFILGLVGCLALALVSCDRDGNTGNGANDPTDKFESDKVKKNADFYGRTSNQNSDSTNDGSTDLNTVDTTVSGGRNK